MRQMRLGGPAAASATAGAAVPNLKRKASAHAEQRFDYLLVYDFEATCDRGEKLHPQELIEFACCIVDTRSLMLSPAASCFQRYLRPTEHPVLTAFCTTLTGIQQSNVDGGMPLEQVLREHDAWLHEQGILGTGATFAPVTWSDWDLKVQLETECKWRSIKRVPYLRRWINLKVAYQSRYKSVHGLKASVEAAGLAWTGRPHSGIDDARNTARLAAQLIDQGEVLEVTGWFEDTGSGVKQLKQATLFGSRPTKNHKTVTESGELTGKCSCGVKFRERTVKRPGENHGRKFYSCGKWSITGGTTCEFFQWCDDKPTAGSTTT